jgi:hypothetical protein
MSLTVNASTYSADSFKENEVQYAGPANTVSIKDKMSLKRTAPKPTSVFSGVGRTEAKLTRTKSLTGALTSSADLLAAVNFTVPVGAAAADIDALCNDMGAFVSSASFKLHVKNQQVNF